MGRNALEHQKAELTAIGISHDMRRGAGLVPIMDFLSRILKQVLEIDLAAPFANGVPVFRVYLGRSKL
jgi:hypothetical protein